MENRACLYKCGNDGNICSNNNNNNNNNNKNNQNNNNNNINNDEMNTRQRLVDNKQIYKLVFASRTLLFALVAFSFRLERKYDWFSGGLLINLESTDSPSSICWAFASSINNNNNKNNNLEWSLKSKH